MVFINHEGHEENTEVGVFVLMMSLIANVVVMVLCGKNDT